MAEEKIQNNARIICFTSRFAPGLRAPVYITSGVLRVPFTVFIGMDGLAALISVPVWVFLVKLLLPDFFRKEFVPGGGEPACR
jgi:membrane protein DedA with SNARE-associated domain